MIEPGNPDLSNALQCRHLSTQRSSFYYHPKGETVMNLVMRQIDEQLLETPIFGVRQMTWHLRNESQLVNEKRILRMMRLMPIYQKSKTSKAAKGYKTYPYLLRNLRMNQPMSGG